MGRFCNSALVTTAELENPPWENPKFFQRNKPPFIIDVPVRYVKIWIYLGKLEYFTHLNLAARKGDDFPKL